MAISVSAGLRGQVRPGGRTGGRRGCSGNEDAVSAEGGPDCGRAAVLSGDRRRPTPPWIESHFGVGVGLVAPGPVVLSEFVRRYRGHEPALLGWRSVRTASATWSFAPMDLTERYCTFCGRFFDEEGLVESVTHELFDED